jgi:PAT family beta-lactamase induction signal transducer AmpG
MSLCDPRVSATQYALLTSLSTLAARLLGFSIGPLQERLGWTGFFVATALFALPGLLLARRLPQGPPPT